MPLEGEDVFLIFYEFIIIYDSHFYAQLAA